MGLWRDFRDSFRAAKRVNEIADQHEELLLEWADYRDKFDRLLRRLTMRSSASRPDIEPTAATVTDRKSELRQIAKQKGLMP